MKILRTLIMLVTVALMAVSAPAQTAGKSDAKAAKKTTATSTTSDLLDINTASADQLKALPGIGDKYSAKIIAGRPYANKSQLVSKGVLPQATYNKIADKVIAKKQ